MNEISYLGAVESLPGSLHHLNLAHNHLAKCFQRIVDDPLHFACSAPAAVNQDKREAFSNDQLLSNNYAVNRHSRNFLNL